MPSADDVEREVRAARNQAMFRALNERLTAPNEPLAEITHTFSIACECADVNCIELMDMSAADYTAVRANPRRPRAGASVLHDFGAAKRSQLQLVRAARRKMRFSEVAAQTMALEAPLPRSNARFAQLRQHLLHLPHAATSRRLTQKTLKLLHASQ